MNSGWKEVTMRKRTPERNSRIYGKEVNLPARMPSNVHRCTWQVDIPESHHPCQSVLNESLKLKIKKRMHFKNTLRRSPTNNIWCRMYYYSSLPVSPSLRSFKTTGSWWPWPLTYDLDLLTWHTDTHTMSKLLHPSLTRGVINLFNIMSCAVLFLVATSGMVE